MRWRKHKMLMSVFAASKSRATFFAFLIELRAGCGWPGVAAGRAHPQTDAKAAARQTSPPHACAPPELRPASSVSRGAPACARDLIRQLQKYLFGLGIVITERNIGGGCRDGLQSGWRSSGAGSPCAACPSAADLSGEQPAISRWPGIEAAPMTRRSVITTLLATPLSTGSKTPGMACA